MSYLYYIFYKSMYLVLPIVSFSLGQPLRHGIEVESLSGIADTESFEDIPLSGIESQNSQSGIGHLTSSENIHDTKITKSGIGIEWAKGSIKI